MNCIENIVGIDVLSTVVHLLGAKQRIFNSIVQTAISCVIK